MTTTLLSVGDAQVIRLDIRVTPEEWEGLYNVIEVYRSVLGDGGPYTRLTEPAWESAVLPEDPRILSGSQNITGKDLQLRVNGTIEVTVTFTGPDPVALTSAANQINALTPQVVASVEAGRFLLRSYIPGGMASLEVLGGDAAPSLGLTVGMVAYGADPDLRLQEGVSSYAIRDYFGSPGYFYKTRFRHTETGVKSAFSTPISGKTRTSVAGENIVVGFVRLATQEGKPSSRQEVLVHAPFLGTQVGEHTIVGGSQKYLTNDDGYCEVMLVRGMAIDVGIGGTSLMRRVNVPTDPAVSRFDLLSPDYGTDDAFAVKRLNLPFAERRNL